MNITQQYKHNNNVYSITTDKEIPEEELVGYTDSDFIANGWELLYTLYDRYFVSTKVGTFYIKDRWIMDQQQQDAFATYTEEDILSL
jgi:hypothetical protein